jgi:hypothetical protein
MMMRLIDADNLKPDAQWDGFYNCYSAYSISQIDDAPTVKAVPIKALYELKSEVEKFISQPRGYIKEVYEMGKDNAYENVLELIDMKILEYGSDAE